MTKENKVFTIMCLGSFIISTCCWTIVNYVL